MPIPEEIVKRYFAVVADLDSTEDDLLAVLHEDVRVIEHPNQLSPHGPVRATWSGTIGTTRGPLRAGSELVAQLAGFLTVEDGRILEHETFGCYLPAGTA